MKSGFDNCLSRSQFREQGYGIAVCRANEVGSEEDCFHIPQLPLLQSQSTYVGLRHRG
jgi:hypothetical protein